MSQIRGNRKQRSKQNSQPARLSRRDRFWIVSILGASVLITVGLLWVELDLSREAELRPRLEKWRKEYHLTEDQVRSIRAEEKHYHGIVNHFMRLKKTRSEAHAHVVQISRIMSPEDGDRFRASYLKGQADQADQSAEPTRGSLDDARSP